MEKNGELKEELVKIFGDSADMTGTLLSLMNNVPGAVYRGLKDWSLAFISGEVEDMTGYSSPEFMRGEVCWRDMIHPDDLGAVQEAFRGAVRQRQGALRTNYRFCHRNGSYRWFEDRRLMIYDENGEFAYVDGLILDVTDQKETEDALRKSEEKFRHLVETMNEGLALGDQNYVFTYVNNRFCEMLGYSREEMVGHQLIEFIHENDRDGMQEQMEKRRKGIIEKFELDWKAKDGSTIHTLASPRAFFDADGRFTGSIGVLMDISDRKKIEIALRESEKKYQALFDHASDAIYLIDPEEFSIIDCNRKASEMIGYSTSELQGLDFADLHPENERGAIHDKFRETIERGPVSVISGLHHLAKDGRIIPVEINADEVEVQDRKMNMSIVRDVTLRKRAEEEIRRERDKAQKYLDIAGVIIVALNTRGEVTLLNRKGSKILGYDEGELVGENWFEKCVPPKIRERLYDGFENFLKGETELLEYYENSVLTKSGEERLVAWYNRVITDHDGNSIGTLSSGEDITERKRMEMELLKSEKLESLGMLAGGLAHDFNNLLTSILGNISMAKMFINPGDKVNDSLRGAEKAAMNAKYLTQQLLTFSKGGAPIKEAASMEEIIVESARFILRGSKVKCEFDIPHDLWHVEIDRGQISQVINNLIINADHAMPDGGTVEIRCKNITISDRDMLPLKMGKYIVISIEDQGTGIPGEHLLKIFDPYFTTKQTGSGIGLSTAYSVVKKHDGYMTVESELGAGTTFHVYIPATGEKTAGNKDESEGEKPVVGKGKILVMDDEEDIRHVASDMLCSLGYEVESARDGAEAIEMYKNAMESGCPFDALIMDLTVPGGMGGEETIKKLREIDRGVKAIVSSGYSSDPIMADAGKYGFVGLLVKPYRLNDLSETVCRVIKMER